MFVFPVITFSSSFYSGRFYGTDLGEVNEGFRSWHVNNYCACSVNRMKRKKENIIEKRFGRNKERTLRIQKMEQNSGRIPNRNVLESSRFPSSGRDETAGRRRRIVRCGSRSSSTDSKRKIWQDLVRFGANMTQQIAYHRFAALSGNLTAFNNVVSPSELIIAYAVLFAIPKPGNHSKYMKEGNMTITANFRWFPFGLIF